MRFQESDVVQEGVFHPGLVLRLVLRIRYRDRGSTSTPQAVFRYWGNWGWLSHSCHVRGSLKLQPRHRYVPRICKCLPVACTQSPFSPYFLEPISFLIISSLARQTRIQYLKKKKINWGQAARQSSPRSLVLIVVSIDELGG